MNKQRLIIAGASGHAKVAIDIIEKEEKYTIQGLLDDNRSIGEEISGYRILGTIASLADQITLFPDYKILIAIGDNWIRFNVMQKILATFPDIEFASAIHPSAQLGKNVTIGKGSVIMAGVIINSDTTIGDFTILNTKSSIDHDSRMFNFSSLAPNVTTGGNVTIGEFSAIGIGATISHGIVVGAHSVIGAGSLLVNDCSENALMYGVPAKKVRDRIIGEKYL